MGHTLIQNGVLTGSDLVTLEAYCVARGRAIDAERVIAKEGRTFMTEQGPRRHPELLTAERAWADARRYEALFGLSPSARTSLGIEDRDDPAKHQAKTSRFFGNRA